MAKLNEYYQKKQLMQQLSEELEKLESDQALKKDLEFEEKIRGLIKEFDKTPKDVVNILATIDPSVTSATAGRAKAPGAPKRALKTYKNPHTGEVVKTRGANHKTLNEWRDKYGKEAVQSWVQE